MQFSCEIWNYDGTGYLSQVETMTGLTPRMTSGGVIGSGVSASMGFLRVATTLLPLGGKPPATADGGDWTELKFDGNLKDSSGRNHNASGSGASYVTTPNQVAVANPKTLGAPPWSNWVSLRAGYPAQLDGSASYSLADASSAVSCLWQQMDGPSSVIWTNQNTSTPTLRRPHLRDIWFFPTGDGRGGQHGRRQARRSERSRLTTMAWSSTRIPMSTRFSAR